MEREVEFKKAILQHIRTTVFSYSEIGRLLCEAQNVGVDVKKFLEDNKEDFGFGYWRGLAFMRFYTESLKNPIVDINKLGVDKTLALIEVVKENPKEFLLKYPEKKLQDMTVKQVRNAVQEFENGEKGVKKPDFEAFFLEVEDSLRETVFLFEGVNQRHPEDFKRWDGRERLLRLLGRLKVILE